ncbi:hypothetical protein A3A54_02765 [Candidatus Curtissbacteria bacterium RIFCSPLOWO2_01_FULL_39_62]|uniref:Uncharacterized protein n=2 Tax=Candidatus Curtissiibacteriota TaxID=1752717 RepID=A0A1F5GA33_9BACT|nr:MAG: hypothetical protein A2775_01565 [Candidatus Curtissbacteria bacterium RIFCSPHIGHO2_01_FULL_39_57]OGD88743.1 MAG: hypothetical protein A3D04_04265 [Candidatus Curtissbacteria bacterium RIFCSPHIGHO2_02_FULL_40_16b]OGD90287.1 MAG: hypothetical protein A3E11_01200 [Candidatus Curtissbacteria bacterium RIFCSPHIGHO2_12_FULL_38_37]OGD99181.1 MAG: hypothetical protein A3J17_00965 [Candidatus Curtissbacteria bacterium RIFCSPLOWO2_02_FULL_40_11]OGE00646.1 MAG: hypothetical protein A3A54_02765 [C
MANLSTDIFVLCDHASVSQEQKLSIIGIFDQFFVKNLPIAWPKMYLVAVVRGEASQEYPLTLKLIPPEKVEKEFPDKEFKIKLGPNGKANVMTELVNFPLQVSGIHKVQLSSGNDLVGEIEFKVNKTTATYAGGQDLAGKKITN